MTNVTTPDFAAIAARIAAGQAQMQQVPANAVPAAPFNAQGGSKEKAPAKPALLYVNLGMPVNMPQEDGSSQQSFISFGGVGLREEADIGKATGLLAVAKTRGHLNMLNMFLNMLEPGESRILGNVGPLFIEIRRPKDPNAAPTATETSVANEIDQLFAAAFAAQ